MYIYIYTYVLNFQGPFIGLSKHPKLLKFCGRLLFASKKWYVLTKKNTRDVGIWSLKSPAPKREAVGPTFHQFNKLPCQVHFFRSSNDSQGSCILQGEQEEELSKLLECAQRWMLVPKLPLSYQAISQTILCWGNKPPFSCTFRQTGALQFRNETSILWLQWQRCQKKASYQWISVTSPSPGKLRIATTPPA